MIVHMSLGRLEQQSLLGHRPDLSSLGALVGLHPRRFPARLTSLRAHVPDIVVAPQAVESLALHSLDARRDAINVGESCAWSWNP
jgi:hypothetical protein